MIVKTKFKTADLRNGSANNPRWGPCATVPPFLLVGVRRRGAYQVCIGIPQIQAIYTSITKTKLPKNKLIDYRVAKIKS